MISTISLATRGRIAKTKSRTLTLATRGWIIIPKDIINRIVREDDEEFGSGGVGGNGRHFKSRELLIKRLREDDEDILIILKIWAKCQ